MKAVNGKNIYLEGIVIRAATDLEQVLNMLLMFLSKQRRTARCSSRSVPTVPWRPRKWVTGRAFREVALQFCVVEFCCCCACVRACLCVRERGRERRGLGRRNRLPGENSRADAATKRIPS